MRILVAEGTWHGLTLEIADAVVSRLGKAVNGHQTFLGNIDAACPGSRDDVLPPEAAV